MAGSCWQMYLTPPPGSYNSNIELNLLRNSVKQVFNIRNTVSHFKTAANLAELYDS
jgi:hypothetical protein